MDEQDPEASLDAHMNKMLGQINRGASGFLFKLDGHTPVPCDDFMEWAMTFQDRERIVQQDQIGNYRVSTVFLGINTRLYAAVPKLFETMVFLNNKPQNYTDRYCTWDEALAGHQNICAALREGE